MESLQAKASLLPFAILLLMIHGSGGISSVPSSAPEIPHAEAILPASPDLAKQPDPFALVPADSSQPHPAFAPIPLNVPEITPFVQPSSPESPPLERTDPDPSRFGNPPTNAPEIYPPAALPPSFEPPPAPTVSLLVPPFQPLTPTSSAPSADDHQSVTNTPEGNATYPPTALLPSSEPPPESTANLLAPPFQPLAPSNSAPSAEDHQSTSPVVNHPPQNSDGYLPVPSSIPPVISALAPQLPTVGGPKQSGTLPPQISVPGTVAAPSSPISDIGNATFPSSPVSSSPATNATSYRIPVAPSPNDLPRAIRGRAMPPSAPEIHGKTNSILFAPSPNEVKPAARPMTHTAPAPATALAPHPSNTQTAHHAYSPSSSKAPLHPPLTRPLSPSRSQGPIAAKSIAHGHNKGDSSSPVQPPQLSASASTPPSYDAHPVTIAPSLGSSNASKGSNASTQEFKVPAKPPTQRVWALPPPPPNLDCNFLVCPDPLVESAVGSPCACVLPIKVALRLSITLYSFFPAVPDFARDVARGVNMEQKQVRVMGANVASDQSEKTDVLIDLVPIQEKFDNYTAFSAYESFWKKQVTFQTSLFGDYEVLYVLYPGLPQPASAAAANVDVGVFGSSSSLIPMKPLGVDVKNHTKKRNGTLIAVIFLSAFMALVLCIAVAWLLMREKYSAITIQKYQQSFLPQFGRTYGTGHTMLKGRLSSASSSFSSSIATYAGQAKSFRLAEIESATNNFDDSHIVGEGGFGCVYRGMLNVGTKIAVKVLKRYDYQGEREFLAEVEMLSRLHHRNLVKLIGICTEENARCLVYELVPGGSVESHLHGLDKEGGPLDWNARMKIALGAARGLAYLHEDSSPCVIHRDFKSSNILLEHDMTPKVSDFGLAKAAVGEGNQHISTQVMGTFGYVAPEYAMTGHLLVKSDVYSYGVVLLELITGRKPVDMSRPPGQENLVTWARPLLTSIDGLEEIMDPALGWNFRPDSAAKVAAIASMCVQPEVTHRPSMSEVVQALKFVCSECNDLRGLRSWSQEIVGHTAAAVNFDNGIGAQAEGVLIYDMLGSPPTYSSAVSDYHHWHSSSGPIVAGKKRKFWQRLRTRSDSENGTSLGFETRSEGSFSSTTALV